MHRERERAHNCDKVYFVSQREKDSNVCIYIGINRDSVVGSSLTTHCPLFVSKYARYILYTVRSIRKKLDIDKSQMENSPVFSNSVFGVSGRLIMSMSCVKINGIYVLVSGPAKYKRDK